MRTRPGSRGFRHGVATVLNTALMTFASAWDSAYLKTGTWATCPARIWEFGGPRPLRNSLRLQPRGTMLGGRDGAVAGLGHSIILQCLYKKHLVCVDTPGRLFSQRAGSHFYQISTGSAQCALSISTHSGAKHVCLSPQQPRQGARLAQLVPYGNPQDNGGREQTSEARSAPCWHACAPEPILPIHLPLPPALNHWGHRCQA